MKATSSKSGGANSNKVNSGFDVLNASKRTLADRGDLMSPKTALSTKFDILR